MFYRFLCLQLNQYIGIRMNAPLMMQRMRMRSQLILRTNSSSGLRRQQSAQSYRSESARPSSSLFNQTFKGRFQRILKDKKIHMLLDSQPNETKRTLTNYNSTNKVSEIQNEVTKCKKDLNDLIVKRKAIQNNSNRVKHEIKRLQSQRKDITNNQNISEIDVKLLVRRDAKLQHLQEDNYHWMKCYQEMSQRYRKDMIIWKARYMQLDVYFKEYSKILEQRSIQQSSLVQANSDLLLTLTQTKKMVQDSLYEKDQAMSKQKEEIQQKRDLDRWKIERDTKKQQFKQLAGIDQQKQHVVQYRAYYLANKFLLKMLRNKGEMIIQKHRREHRGFDFIRQNTGLNTVNTILQRMQIQDQLYDDLLHHIDELQSKLKTNQPQNNIQQSKNYVRNNGFKQREIDQKIQRLRITKSQRIDELKQVQKFDILLKDWAKKNNTSCNESQGQSITQLLEKVFKRISKKTKEYIEQTYQN